MAVDVVIVGAGLSGLYAAKLLHEANKTFRIVDRDTSIGGRVQTDEVDGFLLDRGFQILLPAYTEAKKAFDYTTLELERFTRGARIYLEGKWEELRDPMDAPFKALLSAFSSVGTFNDKLGVAYLQQRALRGTLKGDDAKSTLEYLQNAGFSDQIIDRFFQPFFEGVFLEPDLERTSKEFAYYFSLFAEDGAALPHHGMNALPNQLAEGLPEESFILGEEVKEILEGKVIFSSGEALDAEEIILAVDESSLGALLNQDSKQITGRGRGTTCIYFSGPGKLRLPPILHLVPGSLNGISNIAPISAVSRAYSPSGQTLFSVNVTHREAFDDKLESDLIRDVADELVTLFGDDYKELELVKAYSIPHALPTTLMEEEELFLPKGVHLAGDVSEQGSINGALVAGRRAAEKILAKS